MGRLPANVGLALAAILAIPDAQPGQGAAVYEHSPCASSRAGAAVADPCADGSAIFYSPAALALRPGLARLGATGIVAPAEFIFDETGETVESEEPLIPVPHGYVTRALGDRWGVGIGVFAPHGLTTRLPRDFEGAFVGFDNMLQGVYIQPTAAVQAIPGRLSLGAGVDVVRGAIELHRLLDLAAAEAVSRVTFGALGFPSPTAFAEAELEGDAWGATLHVAALATLTERLSIGARYLHEVEIEIDEGEAEFDPVATGLVLPPDWQARTGYARTTAATPDVTVTPLLPEGDRNLFSGGVG